MLKNFAYLLKYCIPKNTNFYKLEAAKWMYTIANKIFAVKYCNLLLSVPYSR